MTKFQTLMLTAVVAFIYPYINEYAFYTRGYPAIGGEEMLFLIPITIYALSKY